MARPHPLPDRLIAHRLDAAFYRRATAVVAKQLIGKALLHRVDGQWLGGWIVETEAYLDRNDPASHAARGKTPSNASMFAGPGTLYVYPIHAKYCLNAVTQDEGQGAAVLVRAIEPIWGLDRMRQSRGHDDPKRLTRGPAMLCQALRIDRKDDGRCLVRDEALGVFDAPSQPPRRVRVTKRIGISKAQHRNLRFIDANSDYLSRKVQRTIAG
ncbi:DNA-3-methyladenine glycosylase [Rhodopirellula sp. JC639]|uniref:DNA-3-methyladenine glycosylase n=1 Tax=Stieleria mannarensis TaxID=2755585 RepID=UPI00160465CF|nr:DNA-3-methyladenine glycosylase [Rhodopirellula sp. JC639]